MCSVGKGCTVLYPYVSVCVCLFADKSIRDGTGRGDPCDSQRVERIWIKGHMHLLCCYRKVEMQVGCVFLFSDLADNTFASSVHVSIIRLNKSQGRFLLILLFYCLFHCPLLPLYCALSSVFFLLEEKHSPFSPASVVHFCLVLFVEAQWSVTYWPLDRFQTTHTAAAAIE